MIDQVKGNVPYVSIVLPTYNRAHTIKKSVESLLAQTYQDFEIIIIDDGSVDDTDAVLENLKRTDYRINSFKHPYRKGANAARNKGIHEARGKYIAFQDSDDEWLPEN